MPGTARCIVILLTLMYEMLHIRLCPAQANLIPEPSFENHIVWSTISPTTADYFTANLPPPPLDFYSAPWNVIGYQQPRTGLAYKGIITYWILPEKDDVLDSGTYYVEYFKTQLSTSLKANSCYHSGLYFVNANYNKLFSNRLGILFSDTVPAKSFPIQVQFEEFHKPQIEMDSSMFFTDTLNWTLMDGVFKAKGNERIVIYGNFYPKERTQTLPKTPITTGGHTTLIGNPYMDSVFAYIYIDDVFLYEIPAASVLADTTLCLGQSVTIGLNNDTTTAVYNWFPSSGLSCTNCPNPIATPSISTTYNLVKTVRGCFTQATLRLSVSPKPSVNLNLNQNKFCVDNATLQLQGSPPGGSFTIIGPTHTLADDLFTATQPGLFQFQYHYTDDKSCSNSSAFQNLWVYPLPAKPSINKKDSLLCVSRGTITLSTTPTIGEFSGENINGPVFKPNTPGNTTVYYTVSDNNNCKNSDTLVIKVLDCQQGKFAIPNVFTPNADGINDQWKFELPYGVTLNSLEIFNRWGVLVYERKGEAFPDTRFLIWDGYTTSALPCDEGTYFYILHTTNESDGPKLNRGTISLSR